MRRPARVLVPLPVLAEAVGVESERLPALLGMFAGVRGVKVVGRQGLVRLPVVALRRLGLSREGGVWRVAEEEPGPPKGRAVRLDSLAMLPADPRARTPLEEVADGEDLGDDGEPPNRVANIRRWLEAYSATVTRPSPPPPRSFDLESLRKRLETSPSPSQPPRPS